MSQCRERHIFLANTFSFEERDVFHINPSLIGYLLWSLFQILTKNYCCNYIPRLETGYNLSLTDSVKSGTLCVCLFDSPLSGLLQGLIDPVYPHKLLDPAYPRDKLSG